MKTSQDFVFHEGFWHSKDNQMLPKPVPRDKPWNGQRAFLKALATVEETTQKKHYRGWSNCRICDCENGSSTHVLRFQKQPWKWPSGYAHYISEHNVRPSLPFQTLILFLAETPMRLDV